MAKKFPMLGSLLALSLVACTSLSSSHRSLSTKKLVIAHRGASGNLPEHTLASAAMAHAQGVDYIEVDVVLTKDSIPVVLHDIYLDETTNVAQVFPQRHRRYRVRDFTLAQIKQLKVYERFNHRTGRPFFPLRFAFQQGDFRVATLEEFIQVLQSLNRTTGRPVGLYLEIKNPAYHAQKKQDITRIVMNTLQRYQLDREQSLTIIECFDPSTLQRLKREFKTKLPLIQLIGEESWEDTPGVNYRAMRTWPGLQGIAQYASGIGPSLEHVFYKNAKGPGLVAMAHQLRLQVHPYTVRKDQLPSNTSSLEDLLRQLYFDLDVDGVFTDFGGETVEFLRQQHT